MDSLYRPSGNNLLSLRKLGQRTAYFVNGVCLFVGETLPHVDSRFGLKTGPQTTAAFDSLRISYLRAESSVFEERLAAYQAAVGDSSQTFFNAAATKASELAAPPLAISEHPVSLEVVQAWLDEAFAQARSLFAEVDTQLKALPDNYSWVAAAMTTSIGSTLVFSDDFRTGQPYLENAMRRVRENRQKVGAYIADALAISLTDIHSRRGDLDAAFEIATAQLPDTLTLPPIVNSRKAYLLNSICGTANQRLDFPALKKYAQQLLQLARADKSAWLQAQALNYLGLAYADSLLPPDQQQAKKHFENALELAKANDFLPLVDSAQANLALIHHAQGNKPKAKQIYAQLVQDALARGDKLAAETYLNNKASLHMLDQEWDLASQSFQQAVAIVEEYRAFFEGIERIRFLEMRSSAYVFLAKCLALAKDPQQLFQAQNAVRARVLAETLLAKPVDQPVSLAAFQATLASDEAALFDIHGKKGKIDPLAFVLNSVQFTDSIPPPSNY